MVARSRQPQKLARLLERPSTGLCPLMLVHRASENKRNFISGAHILCILSFAFCNLIIYPIHCISTALYVL